MAGTTKASLKEQIRRLTAHLQQEHPELIAVVRSFRRLDQVAYRLGVLDPAESYATQVSWWPVIAVLGTFSSGKSTFINSVLGQRLQATGNQAVDDKFTVICYGRDRTPRVLPGLALDSDPRFPLYRISGEIEAVLQGEGQRLDSYLQLKTCDSEALRGKILIDSPGFDADEQRTSTLRITKQIVDLSDLVLVFFDARHPEPGAMRDTLEHLVTSTLQRADLNKFVFVLNQIDNAAREDNPEEVFAAWQRALAQKGLTAGRFYQIYDPAAAVPIDDPHLRGRFEAKRAHDVAAILERIRELEVERSYRVAGRLEHTATRIREQIVPRLEAARRAWKHRVLWLDALVFGGIVMLAVVGLGVWSDWALPSAWRDFAAANPILLGAGIAVAVLAAWQLHRWLRAIAARPVLAAIRRDGVLGEQAGAVAKAFERNVDSWWPFLTTRPRGWTARSRRKLDAVLDEAHAAVQRLNDLYTDPSGRAAALAPAPGVAEPPEESEPPIEPESAAPAWRSAQRRLRLLGRRPPAAAQQQDRPH